ncbi:MAG: response regulator, partial [Candidatus Poribacteria bacterium]
MKILIVEDELGPRESYRQILKNDYDVIPAENGRLAIDYVNKNPVDVALVDIKMPGIDGIEVLKQIKRIQPQMEVVIITAFASVENAKNAIK